MMESTINAAQAGQVGSMSEMFEQMAPFVQKYSVNLSKLAICCNSVVTDDNDLAQRMALVDELFSYAETEDDLPAILAHSVTNRVYEYEQANLDIPEVSPSEALAHFISENNLKQKDLAGVATQSIISEILRGKRKMTVGHIKGFARFFGVPEQTFMG
jgi:HTH-type transcriptional regulator/antitoxin HigA